MTATHILSKKGAFVLMFAVALAVAAVFALQFAPAAQAHDAGPCNDTDGDGEPSGQEYAEHHIVALALEQGLGEDGHKPGTHQGFSVCLDTGVSL